jgi:RecB family endonuclease NucS
MRAIACRARTVYTGRIDAQLSLSDVLLLIRDERSGGDGSCLVFAMDRGLQPRNWAPAGSVLIETPDMFLFTHEARGERLEVYVAEIYWDHWSQSTLDGELTKMGAEREMSDLIAKDIGLLGDGLRLVGREVRTSAGPMDLLCQEADGGRPVAVEVKRRKVTLNDVYQLQRYLDALGRDALWAGLPDARGLLVSPSLAKNAKAFIDDDDRLRFVRVHYDDLVDEKSADSV